MYILHTSGRRGTFVSHKTDNLDGKVNSDIKLAILDTGSCPRRTGKMYMKR